ncbi:MAG: hypothetical protein K6T83_06240 [Alicyclobacillus sp.]|nr:hypothetical protein [Alicyclobacillus sp.]
MRIQGMQYHRPTNYYCEALTEIDEKICALVAERKQLSGGNPGFPTVELINAWADKYGLYSNQLYALFGTLYRDHHFRPLVQPKGVGRNIPIMKAVDVDGILYIVTHLRQYRNASVVYVAIVTETDEDAKDTASPRTGPRGPRYRWTLTVGSDYECRSIGGGGNNEQWHERFIVSPPLPDSLQGVTFTLEQRVNVQHDEPATADTDVKTILISC